jgi:UDP-N-acetylglucosamine pyrophosphorylase
MAGKLGSVCPCFGGKEKSDASLTKHETAHAGTGALSESMREWPKFEEKMRSEGLSDSAISAFKANYRKLCAGDSGIVREASIEPIKKLSSFQTARSSHETKDAAPLLARTAVVKLNGGLGTSMGLNKAKSLLTIKDDAARNSFLDLIALQVKAMRSDHGSNLRFLLMNSFSTSDDCMHHLREHHPELLQPLNDSTSKNEQQVEFLQNKAPKVKKETLEPAKHESDPSNEWNPPGHGDLYPALYGSGTLDQLLSDGVKYLFVSNSDNMGATLDTDLLKHFADNDFPFMMEVCERTDSDKKGGHICRRASDGRFVLREGAQCADADAAHFADISKHKYFNTNNLWVNLKHLKQALEKNNGALPLPLICNEKNIDPRDKKTPKVYQLETAMGAAIECFDNASAVVVPRSRFAPVKTTGDLFRLRSNAYSITSKYTVQLEAKTPPAVELDEDHYKKYDSMEALVDSYPSLINCSKLRVNGKVRFQSGIVFKGICSVHNTTDDEQPLPPGEYANANIELPSSG